MVILDKLLVLSRSCNIPLTDLEFEKRQLYRGWGREGLCALRQKCSGSFYSSNCWDRTIRPNYAYIKWSRLLMANFSHKFWFLAMCFSVGFSLFVWFFGVFNRGQPISTFAVELYVWTKYMDFITGDRMLRHYSRSNRGREMQKLFRVIKDLIHGTRPIGPIVEI